MFLLEPGPHATTLYFDYECIILAFGFGRNVIRKNV